MSKMTKNSLILILQCSLIFSENMTAEWQWDIFETTPSISSYIIAMIVSDLEYEEGPVGGFRDVTVRVGIN